MQLVGQAYASKVLLQKMFGWSATFAQVTSGSPNRSAATASWSATSVTQVVVVVVEDVGVVVAVVVAVVVVVGVVVVVCVEVGVVVASHPALQVQAAESSHRMDASSDGATLSSSANQMCCPYLWVSSSPC